LDSRAVERWTLTAMAQRRRDIADQLASIDPTLCGSAERLVI
jgi:hypothetical protein